MITIVHIFQYEIVPKIFKISGHLSKISYNRLWPGENKNTAFIILSFNRGISVIEVKFVENWSEFLFQKCPSEQNSVDPEKMVKSVL